ncbi:MAG: hypothetical protein KDE46_25530, partial [Caldilineaceae bacterium]|nr:hypothetical protein [Caldilineaceae bacterium]
MQNITHDLRLLLLLGALFLATACGAHAQPASTPTASDAAATGDSPAVWQRVQESGQLVVGTSVDYPPFE